LNDDVGFNPDIIDFIQESVVYEWTGPNGYANSTNDIEIFPTETGEYCVSVNLGCGRIIESCTKLIGENDCPLDAIKLYAKNSCARDFVLLDRNRRMFCLDMVSFFNVLSDLLPTSTSEVKLNITVDNEEEDPSNFRKVVTDKSIFRTFNPQTQSKDGPFFNAQLHDDCFTVLNHEVDDFKLVYELTLSNGAVICTGMSEEVNFNEAEKSCEQCEVTDSFDGDYIRNEDNNILYLALPDLGLEGTPMSCQCFESCSSIPDVNAEECKLKPLTVQNIPSSNEPCAHSELTEIWCGNKRVSRMVTDGEIQLIEPTRFDSFNQGAYDHCDVLATQTSTIPIRCTYRAGCLYTFTDLNGLTQQVIVPSETTDVCPEDLNEICSDDDGGTTSSSNCRVELSGLCIETKPPASTTCGVDFSSFAVESLFASGCDDLPFCRECPNQCDNGTVEILGTPVPIQDFDPWSKFTCNYAVGCVGSDGIFDSSNFPHITDEGGGVKADICFVRVPSPPNNPLVKLYASCNGDCKYVFKGLDNKGIEYSKINIPADTPECFETEIAFIDGGICEEDFFFTNDDPPIYEYTGDPNFPPNTTPKSVTYSEDYTGDPAPNGITERESFYSSGVGSENGQNYFYMQANHVGCEPIEQFDQCGYNNVYWTTKLDINGEGALCGSSNMFWRSGWCACPSNPNLTFTTGWIDGQLPDNYTSTVNKSTTYKRKTNTLRKSSESKDVVLMGATATGELQVIKTYGGTGEDVATAIATVTPVAGNAGFAITGYFDTAINFSDSQSEKLSATGTDAFVAIFDTNGAYLNSRNNIVPGYDVRAKAIVPDSEGNLILVAKVKESAEDLIGYTAIVKLDAQLNTVWTRYLVGDEHSIEPGNIIINDRDRVSISGSFKGHISINGKTLDSDPEMHSSFILTLRKTGNPFVMQRFGDSNAPIVITGIEKGAGDRLYTSGYYTEDIHLGSQFLDVGVETSSFILRTNWRGVFEEVNTFGTTGFFQINDLATDRDKNLAIVGEYAGNINVGGFDFPNDNGEERGFSIAIADVFSNDNNGDAIQIDHDLLGPASFAPEVSKVMDIYPNPFKDIFNIDYYSHISGEVVLVIFDLNGRLILKKCFDVETGLNGLQINEGLSDINGVLQLRTISVEGEVSIDRIIKLE